MYQHGLLPKMASRSSSQPSGNNKPQQKGKRFQKIADLDYVTLKKLADRLDIPGERNWRKLIENMPSCKYDSLTVEKFGLNANKINGSPGYALLMDMSNSGVTYNELITAFKKMQFDTALQDIGYRGSRILWVMGREEWVWLLVRKRVGFWSARLAQDCAPVGNSWFGMYNDT